MSSEWWWLSILLFLATFFGAFLGAHISKRIFAREWERLATESREKMQREFVELMKQMENDRDER